MAEVSILLVGDDNVKVKNAGPRLKSLGFGIGGRVSTAAEAMRMLSGTNRTVFLWISQLRGMSMA